MVQAVEIAKTSKCRYRHGCVVVSNGKIVAVSVNRRVGNPIDGNGWRKSHVHAEIGALMSAGKKAKKSNVYVARVTADGTPTNSEPCDKCLRYMKRLGVSKIQWT